MLHNEVRELLVEGYIKTRNVKAIAVAFSVSDPNSVSVGAAEKGDRFRSAAGE